MCSSSTAGIVGSDFEPKSVLHHVDELTVVNLAVAIGVHTVEKLNNLLLAQSKVIVGQALTQLRLADRAIVVLIEVGKGRAQMALVQIVVALKASCNELCVIDQAVLVRINHVHGVQHLLLRDVDLRDLVKTRLEFFVGERAVTILVHLGESLSEGLNLVFRDTGGDQTESRSLKLDRVHVALHVVKHVHRNLNVSEFLLPLLGQPRVVVRFLSRESLISLFVKKLVDQVFGLGRDCIPNGVAVVVAATEYVVDDFFVCFAAKRRLSRKHDEEDDSHRPVVALGRVASLQHLRGDIVRCSVWSIHDFVLAHLFGETEVDQLDVRVVVLIIEQEVLRLDISTAMQKE